MRKDDQFVRALRRLCDDRFAEKLLCIAGGLLRQDRFAKDLRALQLGLQAHVGARRAEFGLRFPMPLEKWHIEPARSLRRDIALATEPSATPSVSLGGAAPPASARASTPSLPRRSRKSRDPN